MGVVDDPLAQQMLLPNGRRAADALRLPGLRRLGRLSTMPYLAARTLFFDRFVQDALNDGLRQVVILGAGYDSRPWRLARPDVEFYEVDRRSTQDDKRTRAPEGGPTYVPADVTDHRLAEKLVDAGFQPQEPTTITAEGLTVYLARQDSIDLFTGLAGVATAGSRLAVSFESGFERQHLTRRLMRAYYRRGGEPLRFRLQPEGAPAFFTKAGWTIESLLNSSDLDKQHLTGTTLADKLNNSSFVATATR